MELFDLYDIDRRPLGRTMVRGRQQEPGTYRLVIHLCMINSRGEMLIQQRQTDKASWPGMWDVTVSGSVVSGETCREAAQRELAEELGIEYDFSGVRPVFSVSFPEGFEDFFIIPGDADPAALRLQAEEVQAARWASRDEILRMIDSGEFIPYHRSAIDFAFDMFRYGDIFSRGDDKGNANA